MNDEIELIEALEMYQWELDCSLNMIKDLIKTRVIKQYIYNPMTGEIE